jgi:hypothetical protein
MQLYNTKLEDLIGQVVLPYNGKLGIVLGALFDGELYMRGLDDPINLYSSKALLVKSFGKLSDETCYKLKALYQSRGRGEFKATPKEAIEELQGWSNLPEIVKECEEFKLLSWMKIPYITRELNTALYDAIGKAIKDDDNTDYSHLLHTVANGDIYLENIWIDMWMHLPDKAKQLPDADHAALLQAYIEIYLENGGLKRASLLLDIENEFDYLSGDDAFDAAKLPPIKDVFKVGEYKQVLNNMISGNEEVVEVIDSSPSNIKKMNLL